MDDLSDQHVTQKKNGGSTFCAAAIEKEELEP
jgi:hypothetical protein